MSGDPNRRLLPPWIIQLLAWVTGVGGIIADYGFDLLKGHSLPIAYYAVCIGIGFGIDPKFLLKIAIQMLLSMGKITQEEPEKERRDPPHEPPPITPPKEG